MHETLWWWVISWKNNFLIHLSAFLKCSMMKWNDFFSSFRSHSQWKWVNDDESEIRGNKNTKDAGRVNAIFCGLVFVSILKKWNDSFFGKFWAGNVCWMVQFDCWCSLVTGAVWWLVHFGDWCSLVTGAVWCSLVAGAVWWLVQFYHWLLLVLTGAY